MEYKTLFSPGQIGSLTLKNRLVMAPMMMGFGTFDGTATQQMLDYYEARAKGGAGLIITEITRINDVTGASSFNQLAASRDMHIPSIRSLAQRVQKHGAKLFVQLHHPGRQNMGLMIGTVPLSITMDKVFPFYENLLYSIVPAGKKLQDKHMVPRVVSPSKCENSYFSDGVNRALRPNEIQKLITQFIEAAVRVQKAGADGVELHAAHGYLIQQFLSPFTNRRTDEYGGSLENRMRFLLEILSGIKRECGSGFPVIVRLSVDECYREIGQEGRGYTLEEGVEMAKRLEAAGADAIDVSSAAYDTLNYWLEPMSFSCGWRKYMAAAVKQAVRVPIIAANLIRSPAQAEEQLREGVQDFISLGRPWLADPDWGRKAQEGREAEIKRCICCLHCFESMQLNAYRGKPGECAVNPLLGQEGKAALKRDGAGRHVVVVGAGPAGLMCAELLARREFKVTVLERDVDAGGQIRLAQNAPRKEKICWCYEDLLASAKELGVTIQYNCPADAETVRELNPYAVIVATGGSAAVPARIPGIDLPHVNTTTELLEGSRVLERQEVAVIGSGLTGLETAELLARCGNRVTVVEMADTISPGTWLQHLDDTLPVLEKYSVKFLPGHRLESVEEDGIQLFSRKENATVRLQCDQVVLSMGVRSERSLYEVLKPEVSRLYLAGDAAESGNIAHATRCALEIVQSL